MNLRNRIQILINEFKDTPNAAQHDPDTYTAQFLKSLQDTLNNEVIAKREETLKEEQVRVLIQTYGDIDGAHHKQWILDQCLQILLGEEYTNWIGEYHLAGYSWDQGIAP